MKSSQSLAGGRNGCFALEPLEVRRVLSAAGVAAVVAEAVVPAEPAPIAADPLIQDPYCIVGCWSGFLANSDRAQMRLCIDVEEVCGDGEFAARLTFEHGGLPDPLVLKAEGHIDQFRGAFSIVWNEGRTCSGSLVGTVNADAGTMVVTIDMNWMCSSKCCTFTMEREPDPSPQPNPDPKPPEGALEPARDGIL